MGPIKWYRKNPRLGRERPVPWSLGLPIFDEKIGKYVPREPIEVRKKRVPSIRVSEMTTRPSVNEHDPYMKKKGKIEWRNQNQKSTGVGSQTKTGGNAMNDSHRYSHNDGDNSLFFSETTAVNTGMIPGTNMDNGKVVHRDAEQHRKSQGHFSSDKSTTGAGTSKRKKQKREQDFWKKPKPRKPPKILSIRGEQVWFPYGKSCLW
ncbi:hypothetical protein PHISCL_00437 [Aspergillus sclerotialis]|uniref:Uncharacterized protein n=1 Tax=Aspergillus sclerotialis TaxID=2070753 RepID=A0A3A2ZVX8_9EURO|nr:hypothetical protein PHISCL_00437 [Aspergillus sclerotialis]